MRDYNITISESSRELSARDRIRMKDLGLAHKLDSEIEDVDSRLTVTVKDYAVLAVHNDNSENKDYKIYVLEDVNGERYYTGSETMFDSFYDIWNELHDDEPSFDIVIYKQPSTNRQGKYFLTCSLA